MPEKPTVGFFGFCYFHKGLDRLAYYAKSRPDVNFQIFSTKPENDSGYYDKIKELVKRLDVKNFQWNEEYLPEADIVKKLSETTAIFLPYMEYGGYGVSAAVRTCLKAGVPIMSLKNSFFMDAVHYEGLLHFVGENPANYSEWMGNANKFLEQSQNPEYRSNFLRIRDLFVDKYSWKNIAALTQDLYNKVAKE
jgi:glycosyltransferase involved in cell wall biosynthesis